jgi:transposase
MRPTAYRRNARGLSDRQAFEGVRMHAGTLFAAGHSQAEVARTIGVARQNVSRWHAQWRIVAVAHVDLVRQLAQHRGHPLARSREREGVPPTSMTANVVGPSAWV